MAGQTNYIGLVRDGIRLGLGLPLIVLAMLAMVVMPLPPLVLDILFSFNISLSLVVILAVVYILRPLDFAVFPTVLLVATLLRLALNVASTRVVLLEGHTGTGAAGAVIQAFGEFVIGGNYAVGIVVFAILVIINFVVVTKGAGRVSEVSARFTLDALPGKQMAIDADLSAGIISQEEAIERRSEIRAEADFYGSMDGSSKFVRGDAIAGILILLINLFGGMLIGTLQQGMSMADAAQAYVLLTIGDGLVAQIPSLLLATAVAIIVTRMSRAEDMGSQVFSQLLGDVRVLKVAAGILFLLGIVPGLPNLVFLAMGAICAATAWWVGRPQGGPAEDEPETVPQPSADHLSELSWDDVGEADSIGLDIGYRLIPLVDSSDEGELMRRIKGVRKQLSEQLGFLVSPVRIRDDLDIAPNAYRISVMGVPVGEGEVLIDRELAINPGQVSQPVDGIATKEPAYGLDAIWIDPVQRETAQASGYTVVDVPTVVATHLSKILSEHAHELIGHQETQELLDRLAKRAPKLVDELVPKALPLSVIVRVLQELLREQVPITNMRAICQALAEHARQTQDPMELVAHVRVTLARSIVQRISPKQDELGVFTLDANLERILQDAVKHDPASNALEPNLAQSMQAKLVETSHRQELAGEPAVLLVSPSIRPWMARFARVAAPALRVLAYNEIPERMKLNLIDAVGV
jgi:flagellar biosynthesis protein FlhA